MSNNPKTTPKEPRPVGRIMAGWLVTIHLACISLAQTTQPTTAPAADSASEAPRPHVVIFLVDTLRADKLGVYGCPVDTSPVLDNLTKESVVFDAAYAASPWTLPTVVSLMTSTFVCEHGVFIDGMRPNNALPTLAGRLHRMGYATGSFYSNVYAGPVSGMNRGFDIAASYTPTRDEKLLRPLLNRLGGGPKFLYIHRLAPHHPPRWAPLNAAGFRDISIAQRERIMQAMKEYRSLTRYDYTTKRPVGTTDNTDQQRKALRQLDSFKDDYVELYHSAVHLSDQRLGELIDKLKQRGMWDNTLLIFTADHGEEFGEHGGWLHDQSVYEELLRVPLVIRFPHGKFGGQRIAQVATTVDIVPTILDYLGADPTSQPIRGISLMPYVRGQPSDNRTPRVVGMRVNRKKYFKPWHETRGEINIAVRMDNWKAIWNVEPDTLELYDLSTDPGEQHDLHDEQPSIALRLRAAARAWYKSCGAQRKPAVGKNEKLDKRTLEQLRALGYVD